MLSFYHLLVLLLTAGEGEWILRSCTSSTTTLFCFEQHTTPMVVVDALTFFSQSTNLINKSTRITTTANKKTFFHHPRRRPKQQQQQQLNNNQENTEDDDDSNQLSDPLLPPTINTCRIKVIGVGGGGCNAVDRMIKLASHSMMKNQSSLSIHEIEYWSMNTDIQALRQQESRRKQEQELYIETVVARSKKSRGECSIRSTGMYPKSGTLLLGSSITNGLGAGGDPNVGRSAAYSSVEDIRTIVQDTDLCFITAGMGGGTGTGAAPVIAEIASTLSTSSTTTIDSNNQNGTEKNHKRCLIIGIVTKPFEFEGKRRMKQANEGIENLKKYVDTIIVISNDKLLDVVQSSNAKSSNNSNKGGGSNNIPIQDAFAMADDILRQGIVGISNIIIQPGLINVDFADVRSIMTRRQLPLLLPHHSPQKKKWGMTLNNRHNSDSADSGSRVPDSASNTAIMGIGVGTGPNAALSAAMNAISCPLLETTNNITHAEGVVLTITGNPTTFTLKDVNVAAQYIYQTVKPDANVIFGALIDTNHPPEQISITVLATGCSTSNSNSNEVHKAKEGREKNKPIQHSGGKTNQEQFVPVLVAPLRQQLPPTVFEEVRRVVVPKTSPVIINDEIIMTMEMKQCTSTSFWNRRIPSFFMNRIMKKWKTK